MRDPSARCASLRMTDWKRPLLPEFFRELVALRDQLWRHMDANDELLVIDVTDRSAAWDGLTDPAGNWLHNNL